MDYHLSALWEGGHIKFWSRRTLAILLREAGYHHLVFTGAGRIPYLWRHMVFSARVWTRTPRPAPRQLPSSAGITCRREISFYRLAIFSYFC